MKLYIVGGYVRDTLLGLTPHDMDFVVVGATAEEMFAQGFKQVGADFPVFLHPVSGDEFALARIERKNGVGYYGFDTEFGAEITLEEDLARRDLTINAMAYPIEAISPEGVPTFTFDPANVIDPFDGKHDLKMKQVKHIGSPFRDDPVRIFRAARFAARYGFRIHPDTKDLMRDMVKDGEVHHLPMERVWEEVKKGLMGPRPYVFFDYLADVGVMWSIDGYAGAIGGGGLWKLTPDELVGLPLHIRFACISEGFYGDSAIFDKYCIPADCKKLSQVVETLRDRAGYYDQRMAVQKLEILRRAGAIGGARNTSLFEDFLTVHALWCEDHYVGSYWMHSHKCMRADADLIAGQDMAAIIAKAPDPKAIPEFINQYYINLLENNG